MDLHLPANYALFRNTRWSKINLDLLQLIMKQYDIKISANEPKTTMQ
jgi:hypothetical protein